MKFLQSLILTFVLMFTSTFALSETITDSKGVKWDVVGFIYKSDNPKELDGDMVFTVSKSSSENLHIKKYMDKRVVSTHLNVTPINGIGNQYIYHRLFNCTDREYYDLAYKIADGSRVISEYTLTFEEFTDSLTKVKPRSIDKLTMKTVCSYNFKEEMF